MIRVLIGSAGSSTAFNIASRLANYFQNNIQIFLTDTNPKHLVSASIYCKKFFKVSPANTNSFKNKLKKIIINEYIDVYIPIKNDEIQNAINIKKEKNFKNIIIWSSEFNKRLLNKNKANEVLKKNSISVPEIFDPKKKYPDIKKWIIKPSYSEGSKLIKIVNTRYLKSMNHNFNNDYIVQAYFDPHKYIEITVDSFHDKKKNKTFSVCRQRIEVKEGVCTKAKVYYDKKINLLSKKIAFITNQDGLVCYQLFIDKEKYFLTDLNLRAGGATSMTCNSFYDLVVMTFLMKLNQKYSDLFKQNISKKFFYITRQYQDFISGLYE